MRRSLRSGIALGVFACAPAAAAEPYYAGDIGFAYSTGNYHWTSPGLNAPHDPVTLDAKVTGYGGVAGGAAGVSLRWFSVAAEGEATYLATDSTGLRWSTIHDFFGIRVGGRFEARCKYPLFARASFGTQWAWVYGDIDDAPANDNVWDTEKLKGVYGSLGIGARTKHLGILARFDVSRLTSTHATYAPKAFVLAVDAAWF